MSLLTAMMQNTRARSIGRTLDYIMPKGATRTVEAEKNTDLSQSRLRKTSDHESAEQRRDRLGDPCAGSSMQ